MPLQQHTESSYLTNPIDLHTVERVAVIAERQLQMFRIAFREKVFFYSNMKTDVQRFA